MGEVDIVTKEFMRNPEVCADILNYYFFDGDPRILPDELTLEDSVLLSTVVPNGPQEKRRAMSVSWKNTRGEQTVLLIGIESQTLIDYTMPVRSMD